MREPALQIIDRYPCASTTSNSSSNLLQPDHETAQSAVRNLNNIEVGGRPLRIDLADSDPFLEGKTTVRGELMDGGYPGPAEPRSAWRTGNRAEAEVFMANLPPGKPPHVGMLVLDSISATLAGMPPSQLLEVLAQFKVCRYTI